MRHKKVPYTIVRYTTLFILFNEICSKVNFLHLSRHSRGPCVCFGTAVRGAFRDQLWWSWPRVSLSIYLSIALTLEVGKSPTEVPPRRRLPVAPPSGICEFASSSSCSWSSNRAHLKTSANMVSRTKERALDSLLLYALLFISYVKLKS